MGRVNFYHSNAELKKVLNIRQDVRCVPRMQAATRNQAFGIMFRVIGNKLVDGGGKAHHLWRDVINQNGAIDTATIQILQKRFGRAAVFFDFRKIWPLALN